MILSPILAEAFEQKPAPKLTIKQKWEVGWVPDQSSNTENPKFSHDETMYLHAGRLYSLESGKLLGSHKDCKAGFFDKNNRPIGVCWPEPHGPLTFHDLKNNMRLKNHWKIWEDVYRVYPVSHDRILIWKQLDNTTANLGKQELVLFDPAKPQAIQRRPLPREEYFGTRNLMVSSNQSAIAIIYQDEKLGEIWRISDGAILSTTKMPWNGLAGDFLAAAIFNHCFAISPDLKYLTYPQPSAKAEQTIVIIDPESGKEIKRIQAAVAASHFMFSRGNKWLISTQGPIQVWDFARGENLVTSAYKEEATPEQVIGIFDNRLSVATLLGLRFQVHSGASLATYSEKLNRMAIFDESLLQIFIMSIPDFQIDASIKVSLPPRKSLRFLHFSQSGKYLVGGYQGKLIMWEIQQRDS